MKFPPRFGMRITVAVMVIGFGLTAGAGGQAGSHDPIFPTVVDLAAGESPDWNWFHTVFTFFNSSTTSQQVVVITHGSEGEPEPALTDGFRIPESKVSLTLPPGTMKYLRTARTFPAFNGRVRVTASESVKVNARLWVRDRGCTAPLIADGVPPVLSAGIGFGAEQRPHRGRSADNPIGRGSGGSGQSPDVLGLGQSLCGPTGAGDVTFGRLAGQLGGRG